MSTHPNYDFLSDRMARLNKMRGEEKNPEKLKEINDAILRIIRATYGTCACGAGIDQNRLTLQPLTSKCMKCETDESPAWRPLASPTPLVF